jgi:hypothetical protein
MLQVRARERDTQSSGAPVLPGVLDPVMPAFKNLGRGVF